VTLGELALVPSLDYGEEEDFEHYEEEGEDEEEDDGFETEEEDGGDDDDEEDDDEEEGGAGVPNSEEGEGKGAELGDEGEVSLVPTIVELPVLEEDVEPVPPPVPGPPISAAEEEDEEGTFAALTAAPSDHFYLAAEERVSANKAYSHTTSYLKSFTCRYFSPGVAPLNSLCFLP